MMSKELHPDLSQAKNIQKHISSQIQSVMNRASLQRPYFNPDMKPKD